MSHMSDDRVERAEELKMAARSRGRLIRVRDTAGTGLRVKPKPKLNLARGSGRQNERIS